MIVPLLTALHLLGCADKPGADTAAGTAGEAGGSSDSADGGGSADTGCDQDSDSDGDGYSDCEERECVSDPADSEEWCYACGWPHNDPGTLSATGDDEGDVIKNITLLDTCEEWVDLWDFAGTYWLLMITTSWCEPCYEEAKLLPAHQESFRAESGLGEDFGYMVVLYQDALLNGADHEDAAAFAAATGIEGLIPVLAEPTQTITGDLPWEDELPGKCVLTPAMEILYCYTGSDDTEAFARITEHAAR